MPDKILTIRIILLVIVVGFFSSCQRTAGDTWESFITMNVHAGLDGYYRGNIPIPVSIDITNNSGRRLDARIAITSKAWMPRSVYMRDVHLKPAENASFDMFVYEGADIETLNVRLIDRRNGLLASKEVPLKPLTLDRDILLLNVSSAKGEFEFIRKENFAGIKRFKASFDPDSVVSFPSTLVSIHEIYISDYVHPMLSSGVRSWTALSSVFMDIDSYAHLDGELKKTLSSWVRLGGDLLLYPPENGISQETAELLQDDSLFDFFEWRIAEKEKTVSSNGTSLLKDGLFKYINPGVPGKYINGYLVAPIEEPLIYSGVQDAGTITLLCFNPLQCNGSRASDWCEIFFQLGLLTPIPDQFISQLRMHSGLFGRFQRGKHIPAEETRELNRIYSTLFYVCFSYLFPIIIIALLALLFYRHGNRGIFFGIILPVSVVVVLIFPTLVKSIKFGRRQFEAFHMMYSSSGETPIWLDSVYLIRKGFPETGLFKIKNSFDSMVLDEFVSGTSRHISGISVLEPDGCLLSNEKTSEPFRVIISENEMQEMSFVDGSLVENPDGTWTYEITNSSPYDLSNCDVYPYDSSVMNLWTVDDIPAGSTVKGKIKKEQNSSKVENEAIDYFVNNLDKSILDASVRSELVYGLEALTIESSYRIYHDAHRNLNQAVFFAWTDGFSSGLKVSNKQARGVEMTLVLARLKMVPIVHEDFVKIMKIENLMVSGDGSR